jgi:hypothetical protein
MTFLKIMIPGEDSTREKPTPKNLALPVPSRKKFTVLILIQNYFNITSGEHTK